MVAAGVRGARGEAHRLAELGRVGVAQARRVPQAVALIRCEARGELEDCVLHGLRDLFPDLRVRGRVRFRVRVGVRVRVSVRVSDRVRTRVGAQVSVQVGAMVRV